MDEDLGIAPLFDALDHAGDVADEGGEGVGIGCGGDGANAVGQVFHAAVDGLEIAEEDGHFRAFLFRRVFAAQAGHGDFVVHMPVAVAVAHLGVGRIFRREEEKAAGGSDQESGERGGVSGRHDELHIIFV